jgi:hypothetical protein
MKVTYGRSGGRFFGGKKIFPDRSFRVPMHMHITGLPLAVLCLIRVRFRKSEGNAYTVLVRDRYWVGRDGMIR